MLHIPRSGNTHADSLATLATSSTHGLPWVILVEDLCKPIEVEKEVARIHQVRVGPSWMDLIVLFLKEDILLEEKSKVNEVRRKDPSSGCPRIKNCTSVLFLGRICYAYTQKPQSYSSRSYTKGFVEATLEAVLCLTEPSLRATSGQIYRKKHKSM